ncbi:ATP-binding protein [Cryptosporangium sp. NPDC048952]|uniref:ATP-binding protein n=1 Tax=Cryptosporangium sp. NPDC048952 TaxID=3363961 RepID=UPI00371731A5
MSRRWRTRGLRPRLVTAFVVVTVIGVAATAWSSARSAGAALVDTTQQQLTGTLADRITALTPQVTYPPDQATLDRLRASLGPNTLVTYQGLQSADGERIPLVTDAVREAVRLRGRLVAQRITADGTPWLVIGTAVVTTAPDGTTTPSGIEVYAVRDLTDVAQRIDALTRSAIVTASLALPLAVLLALSAARRVLRPVRELRTTARRLADGDLGARSPPSGDDELADLAVSVNEMAESLQTSMATMRQMQSDARRFAADVAHELRTPLSTLTAVVEVLADEADGMQPDARESARLAIAEVDRLVRLVEDLMEVARFDAGTARLRVEEVVLADSVRDCVRARGWTERVDVVVSAEHRLRADKRRLDVIVANLVGNALRHGRPPVRVRAASDADDVRVEVTDHGAGLSDDALPHVFDRFSKFDPARSRTAGSGLGLAIARENARLHGGDLTAENIDGGGARFVLRLPRNGAGT